MDIAQTGGTVILDPQGGAISKHVRLWWSQLFHCNALLFGNLLISTHTDTCFGPVHTVLLLGSGFRFVEHLPIVDMNHCQTSWLPDCQGLAFAERITVKQPHLWEHVIYGREKKSIPAYPSHICSNPWFSLTQKALFYVELIPKSKALYANDSWLSTQKRIRMSDINRLLGLRPYPGKPAGAAFGNPQWKHQRFQKPKVMGNDHVMMWVGNPVT